MKYTPILVNIIIILGGVYSILTYIIHAEIEPRLVSIERKLDKNSDNYANHVSDPLIHHFGMASIRSEIEGVKKDCRCVR